MKNQTKRKILRTGGLVGIALLAAELSFEATGKGLVSYFFPRSHSSQASPSLVQKPSRLIQPTTQQNTQSTYFILGRHGNAQDARQIQEEIKKLKAAGGQYSHIYLEGPMLERNKDNTNKKMDYILKNYLNGSADRVSFRLEFKRRFLGDNSDQFKSELLIVCAEENLTPRVFETYTPAEFETLDSFTEQITKHTKQYIDSPDLAERQSLVEEIVSLEVKKALYRNDHICKKITAMPTREKKLIFLGSYHFGVPQHFHANERNSGYGSKEVYLKESTTTPCNLVMTRLLANPNTILSTEEKKTIFDEYEANLGEYKRSAIQSSQPVSP